MLLLLALACSENKIHDIEEPRDSLPAVEDSPSDSPVDSPVDSEDPCEDAPA